jgi:hypothetical protein
VKTLYYDIETSPNLGYVWSLWNQNLSPGQVVEFSEMLSFAAKWKKDKHVYYASVQDVGKEEMLLLLHELMTEADCLVTYNGNKFDNPTVNRELALAGLHRPAPSYSLDLYREVKKNFNFQSYKLDSVLKAFGHKGKVKHQGFDLWLKFMAGDEAAVKKFRQYNVGDVTSLEWLDNRLGSWINRPNANLYEGNGCPDCGSAKLQRRGFYRTDVTMYQRFFCTACKGWSRGAKRVLGADERGL